MFANVAIYNNATFAHRISSAFRVIWEEGKGEAYIEWLHKTREIFDRLIAVATP